MGMGSTNLGVEEAGEEIIPIMLLTTEDLSSLLLFTVVTDEWVREVHRFTSQRKKKQCYVIFRNRNNRRLYSLEELKQELGNAAFLDFVEFKTAFSHDIVSNKVGANSKARKCAKSWMAKPQNVDECVLKAQLLASEVEANLEVPEVTEINTADVEVPKASVIENIVEEVPEEPVSIPTETLSEPEEDIEIVDIVEDEAAEVQETEAEIKIPDPKEEEIEEVEVEESEVTVPVIEEVVSEIKESLVSEPSEELIDEHKIEEPVVEITKDEPIVEIEAEIKKVEPVVEIVKEEAEPELTKEEPSVEITKEEPVVEIVKEEPNVEIKKEEPVVETKTEEESVEIKKDEPVIEIKEEKPVVEIKNEEPVVEIVKGEPVVETTTEKPVCETKKEEANVSNLVNVLRAFEESMKQEESSENIVEADKSVEVEKETIECLSEDSASDLGSLDSPLDDSDGDNSIEGEEKHDPALENEKEDEITKEKKVDIL